MSWAAVFDVVAPAFAVAAVGYAFGAFAKNIDTASLTDVVMYVAGPSLIFTSLASKPVDPADLAAIAGGAVTIVLGVGVLLYAASAATGHRPGILYLPAMFMNAGNMLLPLSLFAFGEEGLRIGVIVFVTVSVLQSSLGVVIAGGGSGGRALLEMFRLPYIYSVAAAVAVRSADLTVPTAAWRALELLGAMTIPLMLIALGLRLRTVSMRSFRGPVAVTAFRIGGGYAVACAYCAAFGVEGTMRECLLLASVMPSAVITFVFAEKYGRASDQVAATVFASTMVSLVTTPLLLAFGL